MTFNVSFTSHKRFLKLQQKAYLLVGLIPEPYAANLSMKEYNIFTHYRNPLNE
jgi:hypothetical protein